MSFDVSERRMPISGELSRLLVDMFKERQRVISNGASDFITT